MFEAELLGYSVSWPEQVPVPEQVRRVEVKPTAAARPRLPGAREPERAARVLQQRERAEQREWMWQREWMEQRVWMERREWMEQREWMWQSGWVEQSQGAARAGRPGTPVAVKRREVLLRCSVRCSGSGARLAACRPSSESCGSRPSSYANSRRAGVVGA